MAGISPRSSNFTPWIIPEFIGAMASARSSCRAALVLAGVRRVSNIPGATRIRISVYVKMDAGSQGIGLQAETEDSRIVGLNLVPGRKVFDPQAQGPSGIDYELDLVRREIFNPDVKGASGSIQPAVLLVVSPCYYHISAKFLTEPLLKHGKSLLK